MTTRKRSTPKPASHGATAPYRIKRLDQVRLLAHPLRLRLFEAFAIAPRTTHQVALSLGLAPTRLYHHVNALERVGLLELRDTRRVRGATEKYYQSVGRLLEVEPELFAPGRKATIGTKRGDAGALSGPEIGALLSQLLDRTGADLSTALASYRETPASLRPVAARVVLRASPAKIAALRRRVVAWIKEFSKPAKGPAKQPAKGNRGARAPRGASRATLTLVFASDSRGGREERDPDAD